MRGTGGLSVWRTFVCVGGLCVAVLAGCSASGPSGVGGAAPRDDQLNDNIDRDDQAAVVAREIEEADIVKYDDGYLYLANRYRGLRRKSTTKITCRAGACERCCGS